MQLDFHYYATYAAAYLAGYSHEESMAVCYSAQFVDVCSATLLSKLRAPRAAATTQLPMEMADALIAETCMEHNETLATANDKHYKVVE